MRATIGCLTLLAACGPLSAQTTYTTGPLDVRNVMPLTPPPEYARWWAEVAALVDMPPVTPFKRVEWWTTDTPIRCPVEREGIPCRVHGLYLGPKDIVLAIQDVASECWVKHEIAHAVLGRGDEAHDHPIFGRIQRSCSAG